METKSRRSHRVAAAEKAPWEPVRVAMVTAEVAPFSKVGGLADVLGALPTALRAGGVDVCVVAPYYPRRLPEGVNVTRDPARPALRVPGPWATDEAELWRGELAGGVPVFLIGAPCYFDRAGIYADPESGEGYADNAERYAFFSRAVFELLSSFHDAPEVIQLHDHHAAPLALLLRGPGAVPGRLAESALVVTVHNLAYQGVVPAAEAVRLGAPEETTTWGGCLEFYGQANYLKAAISLADRVTTVSPRYAREIQTDPAVGCGLEGVLAERAGELTGILNGADYRDWSPTTDAHIPAQYDRNRMAGKAECRKALQEEMGLAVSARRGRALLGMVGRLAEQKGLDLLAAIAPELLARNVELAVLGTGELRYRRFLEDLAQSHPGRVAVRLEFDDRLAHRITAGADIYLMPSRYEPCGLNQIYSLRYGTIPVVHATGGLADTVLDCDERPADGYGFSFGEYTAPAFLAAVDRALAAYGDARRWRTLMRRAMEAEFGWDRAAREYHRLYLAARGAVRGLASAGV